MPNHNQDSGGQHGASMGPRSDNRGYVAASERAYSTFLKLQWVHGRITVVRADIAAGCVQLLEASMGPRSDNRGYEAGLPRPALCPSMLQWVHGRITVVMVCFDGLLVLHDGASMGPRSDN